MCNIMKIKNFFWIFVFCILISQANAVTFEQGVQFGLDNFTVEYNGTEDITVDEIDLRTKIEIGDIREFDTTTPSKEQNITINDLSLDTFNMDFADSSEYNFQTLPVSDTEKTAVYSRQVVERNADGDYTFTPVNLSGEFRINYPPVISSISCDSSIFVEDVWNCSISGSDSDGDAITKYFEFRNVDDSIIRQNYSTDSSYTIAQTDAHNLMRAIGYVTDGFDNSSTDSFEVTVSNSPPTSFDIVTEITNFSFVGSEEYNIEINITDLDIDNYDIFIYYNGEMKNAYYDVEHNSTLNVTIPDIYETDINMSFVAIDNWDGSIATNDTIDIYFGYIEFNYLDETTDEEFNFSNVVSSQYNILYDDGSVEEYENMTEPIYLTTPPIRGLFSFWFNDTTEILSRGLFLSDKKGNRTGNESLDLYLIDLTDTPYIFQTIDTNIKKENSFLQLYSETQGVISSQKIDASGGSVFAAMRGKEYYIKLIQDSKTTVIGTIQKFFSNTITLILENYFTQGIDAKNNVNWDYQWLDDTLKVTYIDSDGLTDEVCLNVTSETEVVFSNCVYFQNNVSFSYLHLANNTVLVNLNAVKDGEDISWVFHTNKNEPVKTPTEIPSWVTRFGAIFILVAVAGLSTVFTSPYISVLVVGLASLFSIFGWINIPYAILFLLGFGSIFLIMRGKK